MGHVIRSREIFNKTKQKEMIKMLKAIITP